MPRPLRQFSPMNLFFGLLPQPAPLRPESRVYDLKTRLDWGEPALTIIDVRNRARFNAQHIRGAISIPMAELVTQARQSLESDRDIYVYGEVDEEASHAAEQLRRAGFKQVSVLRGGAAAWKAAGFPLETLHQNPATL
ncbi:Rhodanese [Halomicronema hongdechloris C2206]|uniref:Rhodanese n=1 Tax=Halomicronema hongdechloris C2206 TaxID=1641165 RepID=A0A1Z3HMZ9_9CYAN|nr:rhodanese-like domain-containing protein [Halomicronema hongdechloris]ASC71669.1 Rhodanese [Halomicronema hongdechloris C2206]